MLIAPTLTKDIVVNDGFCRLQLGKQLFYRLLLKRNFNFLKRCYVVLDYFQNIVFRGFYFSPRFKHVLFCIILFCIVKETKQNDTKKIKTCPSLYAGMCTAFEVLFFADTV